MTTLDQAVQQMLALGMPDFPSGHPKLNTSRIVRYGPKSKGWYRLWEYTSSKSGKSYISGAFGLHGRLDGTKIQTDFAGMDEIERARMQRELAAVEERERAKRADRAEFAAKRARSQWKMAGRIGPWPYLDRKGVTPEAVRCLPDGTLLVPMLRYAADVDVRPELMGLQKITSDGTKRFNAGMAKEGTLLLLGRVEERADEALVILVGEGYATCRTLRMAQDDRVAVAVAFDAYNLLPAARALRARFPSAHLIFCADDDWKTEGNPGMTKAHAAADATGAAEGWSSVVRPLFAEQIEGRTDFNDLHNAEGLDAVRAQLLGPIAAAVSADAAGVDEQVTSGRRALTLVSSNKDPKKKKAKAPVDWSTLRMMLERYTLLYGTKTAWDGLTRRIIPLDALAAAYPFYFRVWKESTERKMIDQDRVVFDPSCAKGEPEWINLFNGMPLEPAAGSCKEIAALLKHLCGGDVALMAWLLRWFALPLQRPGAKMATAVIMHGDEGSGKNLFLSVLQMIYGEYAMMIGQEQIESRYNEWASKKLFVVANEVLTRQEMRTHKGRLKFYITEPQLPIEGKFMPVRTECNCMNIVFLSNETQPLILDPGDRRYCVLWTPAPLEKDFYARVAAEIEAGGAAAFYRYLLDVPLGDFGIYTRPLDTEAKRDLIDLGKPSPVTFFEEWRAGLTPFPFVTCKSLDAYHGYQLWCQRSGERNAWTIHKFSREIKRNLGSERLRVRMPDGDSDEQYTMFLVPLIERKSDPPFPVIDEVRDKFLLGRNCSAFKAAFDRCREGAWVVAAPNEPVIDEEDSIPL